MTLTSDQPSTLRHVWMDAVAGHGPLRLCCRCGKRETQPVSAAPCEGTPIAFRRMDNDYDPYA